MIKLKKITPLFNFVLTTADNIKDYDETNGVITNATKINTRSDLQKVIAVGPMVKGISIGDTVCINPKRYAKVGHKPNSISENIEHNSVAITYVFDDYEIDGKLCMLITDGDIKFVVNDMEEIKTEKPKDIILNSKPSIVL